MAALVAAPPGPKDSFFGMSLIRRFRSDPLGFLSEVGHTYGDLASLRMGPVQAYLANSPELTREILVTKAKHFHKERRTLDALRQIDGEGLVISEGDLWVRQRRLLQPAFHPRRMAKYSDTIIDRTRRFLDRWQPGEVRDVAADMTHLTVEIIAKLFYDLELSDEVQRLGNAVRVLSETLTAELSTFLPVPDWMPTPAKRRKREAIRTLDTMIRETIRKRRASPDDRGDLLSMLLLAMDDEGDGKGMSDQQARDEAVTMFNAGHDSTAAGLAWIWHALTTHPEVEARLVEEVDAVLGQRPARFEDVPKLRYLDQVVRETLRLYPPVWILFARVPTQDTELGGYPIKKGSWIYIVPWVTHHDARFFPDPDRFDPERFSPERIGDIPQYAWLPFGAGPHVCIGQQLALTEMVLITATILQRFRLKCLPNPTHVIPEPLLAMRPKGGLQLKLEAR